MLLLAPAKINLGLKILGREKSGLHTVYSVIALIDFYDQVYLTERPSGIYLLNHNQDWSMQEDLAYRAAQLLKEASGVETGVAIKVKKKIPHGGGLGGGSSDAAVTLLGLNRLWNLYWSKEKLKSLSEPLGVDCKFFLESKTCPVFGLGDLAYSMTIHLENFLLLIFPPIRCDTSLVYSAFRRLNPNLAPCPENLLPTDQDFYSLLQYKENDLLSSCLEVYPQLGVFWQGVEFFLKEAGLAALKIHLSGSGSTLYLSFKDFTQASSVAKILSKRYNTYLAKTLAYHDPLRGVAKR